jgi:hypothetical protein
METTISRMQNIFRQSGVWFAAENASNQKPARISMRAPN